ILPSNWINRLLVTRDGALWIGTDKGLASWKDGKLLQYVEFAGERILGLVEDPEGAVWAAAVTGPMARKLCAIQKGSVHCDESEKSHIDALSLYEDTKGNLWAGVANGVWRRKPDPPMFDPVPGETDSIQSFAESDDGALLFGTREGVMRLINGK